MSDTRNLKDSQIIILGVCIAVATITASVILSQGAFRIMKFEKELINVTGSAQQQIRSDYAVWVGSFSRRESDLPTAYKKLQSDLETVMAYLLSQNIKQEEITVSQITTSVLYEKQDGRETNKIEGYVLNQSVEVDSKDVDAVTAVSRSSTDLINRNIEFVSWAPQYFYTNLDALKVEMLSKATENAKQRAESMVKSTGNKIGLMRTAKMGVFQITSITSTDVADYGVNDTTSVDKKVMSVVNVSFALE